MNIEKIGKFIANCRKKKGLTQVALAEKIGITDRAVSKWENGKCIPDASHMEILCEILGIEIIDLLSGKRIPKDHYKAEAEKNLKEIIMIEGEKNSKLKKAEEFIVWSEFFVFILTMICGFAVIYDNYVIGIVLLSFGVLNILVNALYAAILEHSSGYYQCKNCGFRYIPPAKKVIFSAYMGSDRILKCPKCLKKDWNKKVFTR